MSVQIDIINEALSLIGHSPITSLYPTEDTKAARLATQFWTTAHDSVVRAANWAFLFKTEYLEGYLPGLLWDFRSSALSWTASGATATPAATYLTFESSGITPLLALTGLRIDGSRYNILRIRYKRTAGSGWAGKVDYATDLRDYNASYYKTISDPASLIGAWTVQEWDLSDLTAGTTDWSDSIISKIRLQLGNTATDDFDLHWIMLSQKDLYPIYNSYGYPLPADCAKVVQVATEWRNQIDYAMHGRQIICEYDKVFLTYVSQPSESESFPVELRDALALKLASQLAIPMAGATASKMAESMFRLYSLEISRAIAQNSRESYQGTELDDSWAVSRFLE